MNNNERNAINESKSNGIVSGIALAITTIILLIFINYFPQGSTKNVASFLAGIFGFTSVQAFRRSFDD